VIYLTYLRILGWMLSQIKLHQIACIACIAANHFGTNVPKVDYRKIDKDEARPAEWGGLFKTLPNDNISNLFATKTAQH
jgi:hypothetical protein